MMIVMGILVSMALVLVTVLILDILTDLFL
jgi:hypothetical protein